MDNCERYMHHWWPKKDEKQGNRMYNLGVNHYISIIIGIHTIKSCFVFILRILKRNIMKSWDLSMHHYQYLNYRKIFTDYNVFLSISLMHNLVQQQSVNQKFKQINLNDHSFDRDTTVSYMYVCTSRIDQIQQIRYKYTLWS